MIFIPPISSFIYTLLWFPWYRQQALRTQDTKPANPNQRQRWHFNNDGFISLKGTSLVLGLAESSNEVSTTRIFYEGSATTIVSSRNVENVAWEIIVLQSWLFFAYFFLSVGLCTNGRNVVLHQLKAVACSCCQWSLKNRNALWSVRYFQRTFFPADIILLAMSLLLRFPLSVLLHVELVSLTIFDRIMWSSFFVCVYVCRGNLKLFFARKNLKILHRDGSLLKMGMYSVCTLYGHLYKSVLLHTFNHALWCVLETF